MFVVPLLLTFSTASLINTDRSRITSTNRNSRDWTVRRNINIHRWEHCGFRSSICNSYNKFLRLNRHLRNCKSIDNLQRSCHVWSHQGLVYCCISVRVQWQVTRRLFTLLRECFMRSSGSKLKVEFNSTQFHTRFTLKTTASFGYFISIKRIYLWWPNWQRFKTIHRCFRINSQGATSGETKFTNRQVCKWL